MEIVYALGEVSVNDVLERMADPPSYSAVRTTLRILKEKGHVEHKPDGPRYVYRSTVPLEKARRAALKDLILTFFDGSAEAAAVALLGMDGRALSEDRMQRLSDKIDKARREGR
jgi:predicted transcriptional regulator